MEYNVENMSDQSARELKLLNKDNKSNLDHFEPHNEDLEWDYGLNNSKPYNKDLEWDYGPGNFKRFDVEPTDYAGSNIDNFLARFLESPLDPGIDIIHMDYKVTAADAPV